MPQGILKSTFVVGFMTFLSRISGLLRDVVFANILGDKLAADVFFVAFRIPNFFRRIFGEGAFSAAFVPVYTEYRANHSKMDTTRFVQLMWGRLGIILLLVCLFGVLFSYELVYLLAVGFFNDAQKFDLAVQASKITFPYLFFISIVAMSGGMLNSCGRFAVPAATPVLLNLCLISAALLFVPIFSQSVIALSVGVLVAGLVQLLFQIPFLIKENISIKPRVIVVAGDEVAKAGVSKVFKLILPAVVGVSVAQINMMVNMILASFLVTGSISWLYYSDRLMEFPLGVFGIALGTVILPDLSKKFAMQSARIFSDTLSFALRWVYLIAIPATVGLIALAHPLVSTIYFHGDFTIKGVDMTASALVAYSLGLTAIMMVKVLAPGYYARQNTKTPVRIAMFAMVLNIIFCLILISPLKHVGLALATTLSSVFNAGMLFFMLKRESIIQVDKGLLAFLFKVIVAAGLMGLVLWWMRGSADTWTTVSIWQRALNLALLVLSGMTTYLIAILAMGIRLKAMLKAPV